MIQYHLDPLWSINHTLSNCLSAYRVALYCRHSSFHYIKVNFSRLRKYAQVKLTWSYSKKCALSNGKNHFLDKIGQKNL